MPSFNCSESEGVINQFVLGGIACVDAGLRAFEGREGIDMVVLLGILKKLFCGEESKSFDAKCAEVCKGKMKSKPWAEALFLECAYETRR